MPKGPPKKSKSNDEKIKSQLSLVVSNIEKDFGAGTIMKLGQQVEIPKLDVVSSGCLSLDLAMGVGGIPYGRVAEIWGPESSGKTTLTLHVIANSQRQGKVCAFIDAEHALDLNYAKRIGINTEELLVSQPDFGEMALSVTERLAGSGEVGLIVIDSVAALTPKAEIEGEMGDSHMGLQARLMSQALRKLTGIAYKTNTLILFINQTRQKIGVMYGDPTTTSGGNALKFYASIRLKIARIGALKQGETVIGNRTKVQVVKNKVAPPFQSAEFDIIYGKGISYEGDLIDLGAKKEIIEKSGAWYSFGGERLGQGRENVRQFLLEHPEVCKKIEKQLKEIL